MNPAQEYIQAVQNNEILVCEYVKLAIQRHLDDLKRQDDDDFPYYFSEKDAAHPLKFIENLRFGLGKYRGERFELMPWSALSPYIVLGWKRKINDNLRYRVVFEKVARKNAKTERLAALGNYFFVGFKEKDPQIFWIATKKDQARIGWERQKTILRQLIKDSKMIARKVDTSRHRIYEKHSNGYVGYLGKDSDTEDGLSPSLALIDEYHAHRDDGMRNVMESGMGGRDNPLTWIISTAGFNLQGPMARFLKVCKQILRGQVHNDEIFALIYELDEGDDWNDERLWVKSNPSLGVTLTMDYLRSEYKKAKTEGKTKEINFKTKNLNIDTNVSETWIQDDDWMKGNVPIGYEELKGSICYAGLDLASTRDTTSLCLLFPPEDEDGDFTALWWYWLPEEEAKNREQNDGIPYTQWTHEGWVTTTPGNVTDYSYIQTTVVELHELYNIQSIAYDRFNSSQVVINLQDEGVNMEPFGQGYRSMSAPTKQMERIVVAGRLIHGGNPVSRWQCSNIQIEMDAAENIKISKRKSNEKVDGMVSLVMAIGEWMDMEKDKEQKDSVYNERDMYVI